MTVSIERNAGRGSPGQPGTRGASGDGSPPAPPRPERRGVTHGERATGRDDGRRWNDQPRDRSSAVRDHEDRGDASRARLQQARDPLPHRAPEGAREHSRHDSRPGSAGRAHVAAPNSDGATPSRRRRGTGSLLVVRRAFAALHSARPAATAPRHRSPLNTAPRPKHWGTCWGRPVVKDAPDARP